MAVWRLETPAPGVNGWLRRKFGDKDQRSCGVFRVRKFPP